MSLAPIVRILIRYAVGAFIGMEAAEAIASDPDAVEVGVLALTALVGVVTEWWYARARRNGGAL